MAKSLLQRSEPETIVQFEAAARLRYFDALSLSAGRGRKLGAVYLFGYSIEMRNRIRRRSLI
jgi:hypothetical protein